MMSKFAKFLIGGGVIIVVVLVGIVIGWVGTGGATGPSKISEQHPAAAQPVSNPTKFARNSSADAPPAVTHEKAVASVASSNLITDWEDKLDHILSAESREDQKAKQLLEMFPNLPEEGQVEVAQHLSNLLTDQDYAPLGHLLTNPALPESVLDVFMADLLNRPNSTKLPLILEVARTPDHPKATEARDLLELFLEENFDNDWGKWQAKLDQWLKDNPD